MARRVIDKQFVENLTEGFARNPGNASAAARHAGCDHRTARRGWAVGWPKRGFRPISEVIQERQEAARALARQQEEDKRQADRDAAKELASEARMDAAKEMAQDGQIARASKSNALVSLATAANLIKRGYIISQKLTEQEIQGLPVKDRIRALKTITEFNKEATTVADTAIRLERLIMGEPESTVQHNHAHVHVDAKDMNATISKAERAIERARKRGVIDTEASEA